MGATIGHLLGELFRSGLENSRVLLAAGAGAGLAAAFNAPVAGAIFVLEELTREFELHTAIAAIGASATAISVSQAMLGNAPDFHVGKLADVGAQVRGLYFLFGFIAGGAAVLYCEALLGVISLAQSLDRRRAGLYAALTGALVGALAWLPPTLSAAATRSLKRRCLELGRCSRSRSCSFSALASPRFPTPPRRRGEYSRQCWFWARSLV